MLPLFHNGRPETPPDSPETTGRVTASETELGSASRASEDGVAQRKKRVITAARKEQNRIAQALFRQRRRDRRLKQREENENGRTKRKKPQTLRPVIQAPQDNFSTSDVATSPGLNAEADNATIPQDSSISSPRRICNESSRNSDHESDSFRPPGSTYADPVANTLEFLPSTIIHALLHNALILGFDLEYIASCNAHTSSPLHRPSLPHEDPETILAASVKSLPTTPPEFLKPTLTQVLIPHHPSLDLIPLPELRDRAITLSAAMPGVFNVWEMKLDIYRRGGLRKLDVRKGKDGKPRSCPPWEKSSWVAAPWFLRKWRIIIDEDRQQLSGGAE